MNRIQSFLIGVCVFLFLIGITPFYSDAAEASSDPPAVTEADSKSLVVSDLEGRWERYNCQTMVVYKR